MALVKTKTCTKCLFSKEYYNFTKRKLSKDGLDTWCKECKSAHELTRNYSPDYNGEQVCTICSVEKPKNQFGIDKRKIGGLDSRCLSCNVKRTTPNSIKRRYGITYDEFTKLNDNQNEKCAICDQKETVQGIANLSIDHCHTTGKVRGLLCNSCNNGLGRFKDNYDLLIAAANYVRKQ